MYILRPHPIYEHVIGMFHKDPDTWEETFIIMFSRSGIACINRR